jgi:hypothetical protein
MTVITDIICGRQEDCSRHASMEHRWHVASASGTHAAGRTYACKQPRWHEAHTAQEPAPQQVHHSRLRMDGEDAAHARAYRSIANITHMGLYT